MKRLGIVFALGFLAVAAAVHASEDIKLTKKQREEAALVNTQLALAYMREGDLATARAKLEKALDQDPDTATTQMAAGFLYDRLGEDDKAKSSFERAMKLGKNDPVIMNNYAAFLCRKGDKKTGEAYFLQAAKNPLYRTPEVAYANAGRCARADGRPKEAEQYFRQALVPQAGPARFALRDGGARIRRGQLPAGARVPRSLRGVGAGVRDVALALLPDRAGARRQRPGTHELGEAEARFRDVARDEPAARSRTGPEVTRPEAEVAELPTDPGSRLERQRELAGLTEQQVAEQLNLDAAAVTALERDDYSALGAPVFVRGHLKRYAALLGLDEDEILGAYERSRAHLSQPTLVPKSRAEMMPDRGRPKWPWLLGGVLLVLLAAAIAAYVSEYGVRLPKWSGAGAGTPVPASAASRQQDGSGRRVRRPAVDIAGSLPGPAEPGAAATSAVESGATPVAVPAGQVALQLRFAADSWVEIYDGSGKAVLYDLGKAGTERVATGTAPLSVTIGNAPAVTMQVNGRGVTLPAPPAGQTVGRYSIGPDGALR